MPEDDDFNKAFEGFGEDDNKDKLSTEESSSPVVEDPKKEAKTEEKDPETTEEKKVDEPTVTPDDDKKTEEEVKPAEAPAKAPETTEVAETPQPLTKDDVTAIISNLRNEERNSGRVLETTTQEVLEKYYPEGLSNTLVDEKSGKQLRTPSDVVEASGGEMSTEEAAQWLMNEQFKLDGQVNKIKEDARKIAETTVNFKRDAISAVEKYEPLFKQYPHLQAKVYEKLMKQVKIDKDKDVVLSAPDVMEHYDDYLEPYQQAFEFSTNKSATNPTAPTVQEPAKPTAEDRMDETGDGGPTEVNDPNDFAQQVRKELAKGI